MTWVSLLPVSYTHLDVYKRQHTHTHTHTHTLYVNNIYFKIDLTWCVIYVFAFKIGLINFLNYSTLPDTHLKMQLYHCMMRPPMLTLHCMTPISPWKGSWIYFYMTYNNLSRKKKKMKWVGCTNQTCSTRYFRSWSTGQNKAGSSYRHMSRNIFTWNTSIFMFQLLKYFAYILK